MAAVTGIDDPSAGFFEAAQDLLHVENPGGFFIKINASSTRIMGYSETGLCRTAVLDLVSPGDRQAVSTALDLLKKGSQAVEFECRCCAADGSQPILHWSVSKQEATGRRYWVGQDITERKRTEALLAGQAKAIGTSQAVIEFRMDGTIIAANERFLALMEYGADDIVGRHHRILVQPEYAASQVLLVLARARPRRVSSRRVPAIHQDRPLRLDAGDLYSNPRPRRQAGENREVCYGHHRACWRGAPTSDA